MRSMLTQAHQPVDVASGLPVNGTPHNSAPPSGPSSPIRSLQQHRTTLQCPRPVPPALQSAQAEAAEAHGSFSSAVPQQPLRQECDRAEPQHTSSPAANSHQRVSGNRDAPEPGADVKDERASASALKAARAAVKAALTPSNGRPPVSSLSAATLAAAGLGLGRSNNRHGLAGVTARNRRGPPLVRTLAELERLYGGRKHRRRTARRPDVAGGQPHPQPQAAAEAAQAADADPADAVSDPADAVSRCNVTPAYGGAPFVVSGGPDLSWEWMVEGVLRQVVLYLDIPSSVVRFRQVRELSLRLGLEGCNKV